MFLSLLATLALAQRPDSASCVHPAPVSVGPTASAWLARARGTIGWDTSPDRVLRVHAIDDITQSYQSDRSYPPFFSAYQTWDVWLDRASGVERQANLSTVYPGADQPGATSLGTEHVTFVLRDTLVRGPNTHTGAITRRALDPWAVLGDWTADSAVRVAGTCRFRDYDRIVLTRVGPYGVESLLLDPKTACPVALTRTEPHYLWGQLRTEYVYSTWIEADHVVYPGAVFRVTDGAVDISRTVSQLSLIPRDSAPSLAVPSGAAPMTPAVAAFLLPTKPDTIRVSSATYLLRNAGYAEAVTLAHDTVFVFDATQGDARAQADSQWIGRLFPGKHPIVVVVTDLAWPHVAGVRWWVANGATIVSHRSSRAFLQQIVDRRWTLAPDRLERVRARRPLVFRPVRDSLRLAAGGVTLYPIDGIASEGALMGFVGGDRFLWASDYVQTMSQATLYGREVNAAVQRAGIAPEQFGAEHLGLNTWAALVRLLTG